MVLSPINAIVIEDRIPKVSAVLSLFNVETYLVECLDSVIGQTLRDIEIICVDGGSTDRTMDILDEYAARDERLTVIRRVGAGYGEAMNIGIDAARGEYIGIVEGDDFVGADMYETLYTKAKEYDLDIAKADFNRFFGDGKERILERDSITKGKPIYNIILDPSSDPRLMNCQIYTWAGIYKRSFLQEYDIRHNITPGASYQDNGFWFQTFCFAKRLMFLDFTGYDLRRDNVSSSFYRKDQMLRICDEYMFIRGFLTKHSELEKRFLGMYQYHKFRNYIFRYNHLAKEFRKPFLERMSREFTAARKAGDLDRKVFPFVEWSALQMIITHPDTFSRIYGVWYDLIRTKSKLQIS